MRLSEDQSHHIAPKGRATWQARTRTVTCCAGGLQNAGEILLQSLDRDGRGTGYDTTLIEQVSQAVTIPVIACSGVGVYEHYAKGLKAGADAVAAANIWHFKELADRGGKRALQRAGFDVRM